jgi:hypothetical protein
MNSIHAKHLFLDIDGTLINSQGELGSGLPHAIQTLRNNGIDVVFCSGRMFQSMKRFTQAHFGTTFPIISYNGAMIHMDSNDSCPSFHHPMGISDALEIITRMNRLGFHYQIYLNDQIYVTEHNEWISDYVQHADTRFCITNELSELILEMGIGPTKILAIPPQDDFEASKRTIQSSLHDLADVFNSFRNYVDICPKDINKGSAIQELARSMEWSLMQCVMIGDSENDWEAFGVVGTGIAMGNADPRVKKRAKYVVSDNDHCGALAGIHLCFDRYLSLASSSSSSHS